MNSEEFNQPDLKLLAKIEKPSAVDDLQTLCREVIEEMAVYVQFIVSGLQNPKPQAVPKPDLRDLGPK